MDFYTQKTYSLSDIESLINNEVEENIHLDYKRAEALGKDDKKKGEITKDISAFANSDGGIIIYGVEEREHKPVALSPLDGKIFTKEWLDQICSNIQQHIRNIEIFPIRINGEIEKSIYVVRIPRSNNAPHMATDHKYYKRNNFQSVAMEEYEVRDLFNRVGSANIDIDYFDFRCEFEPKSLDDDEFYEYRNVISIFNDSNNICSEYKVSIILKMEENIFHALKFKQLNSSGKTASYTILGGGRIKFSITGSEPIYPSETIDLLGWSFEIPPSKINRFLSDAEFEIILWYRGGMKRYNYNIENEVLSSISD